MARNTGKKNKNKFTVVLGIIVLVIGVVVAAPLLFHVMGNESNLKDSPKKVEEPIDLSISCVGDIMVHSPQIPSQYDSTTGKYDYNNNFEYVKKYISNSDLALCNLETTFAGGTYSGYPSFNAPEALAEAIKNTGWDVAMTANNHTMDTGYTGLKRTLKVAREAGLQTTGTRLDGEKNYIITKVKGVKIAVVAYTYQNGNGVGPTLINGVPIPKEAEDNINTFSYATLSEDLGQVKNTIAEARKDGADIVICYFHWGEEYQRSPNDYQLNIARQVANMGADMIFASHPHVIQDAEMLKNESTGKEVPVFYSLGNFISNQRLETLDNRYTEQGLIGEVNLQYMKSTKEILTIKMDAIPVWVDKYKSKGKDVYSVVPLDNEMENNASLRASGHFNRALQALDDIKTTLGENYVRTN